MQTALVVAPITSEDVPVGQRVQLSAFFIDEYVPAAQSKHEDEPDLSE